jgi:ATP-binding cassette, subfamily C, bacterial
LDPGPYGRVHDRPVATLLGLAVAVARFSGRRGVVAVVFVALGAVVEGVDIVLLVPLLAMLFDSGTGDGGSTLAAWAGQFAPDLPPVMRLALILVLFAVLMALRAFVLWRRDTILGGLQIEFVERKRATITQRLAAALQPSWFVSDAAFVPRRFPAL